MTTITGEKSFMDVAVINSAIDPRYLKKYVLDVLLSHGINHRVKDAALANKATAAFIVDMAKDWEDYKYLIVFDAKIFKTLTKLKKATDYLGYVVTIEKDKQFIIYCPNPNTVFTNPTAVTEKITIAINSLKEHINNSYTSPGTGIIKYALYPTEPKEIEKALNELLIRNSPLTIDIEAFSLKHYSAGIASVCLCWNKHEGISFPVDFYGYNPTVRKLLLNFLVQFKNTLIYHNSIFDAHILIYQLFMDTLVDTKGLLNGLKHVLGNFHDTKLIAYLCLNSTARPLLSLKELSQEYSGKYALDSEAFTDLRKIPLADLLQYNLVDGLATWYVYEKYYPKLINEEQTEIYNKIFKPAARDITQTQLTGMPINPTRVTEVKHELSVLVQHATNTLMNNHCIEECENYLNTTWVTTKNSTLKKKRVSLSDANEKFNPNSSRHIQNLLHKVMELPVLNTTDSGQPATDGDTLKAYLSRTSGEQKEAIEALLELAEASKILTTFIPALETAICAEDGNTYLFGNFNLGSTVSGRLSSSSPNLQNLPANSKYGKLIKSCFASNTDALFLGVDFNALEARVGALLPKDEAKLAIYKQGYDSHSYNTFIYWPNKLEHIQNKLSQIKKAKQFYKVTQDDGTVQYLTDTELDLLKKDVIIS